MESVGSPAPGARSDEGGGAGAATGRGSGPGLGDDTSSPEVQSLLRALGANPRAHELGGFEQPLASYRTAFARSHSSARRPRRTVVLSSLIGARLGATLAGLAVGLGAVAVAAYTTGGPGGARDVDHTTIASSVGAATSTPKPTATKTKVGPDATGPAAYGLCNAWTHHQANGAKPTDSVAFRNLATAAGGESKIAAYCATIPHPGNGNHSTGRPTAKPGKTAKPAKTAKPTKPTKAAKPAKPTKPGPATTTKPTGTSTSPVKPTEAPEAPEAPDTSQETRP